LQNHRKRIERIIKIKLATTRGNNMKKINTFTADLIAYGFLFVAFVGIIAVA